MTGLPSLYNVQALPILAVAPDGSLAGKQGFTLLTNAAATGAQSPSLPGGQYIWRVEGVFGGATVNLQQLGLDNVTWSNVVGADGSTAVAATTAASVLVTAGQNAVVRAAVSGATASTSLNSNLAAI